MLLRDLESLANDPRAGVSYQRRAARLRRLLGGPSGRKYDAL
jgi:hypothetical protein